MWKARPLARQQDRRQEQDRMSAAAVESPPNYLRSEQGIQSWLLTTDHKRIAWLYIAAITAFFFVGGFAALLMRLELLTPQGDLVTADNYNKLFSMHGIIMVWFF